jgi:Homeodomain
MKFQETPRPSKVMMLLIAKQLELDLTSVQNYFMNARRRQAKLEASCNSSSSSSEITAKVKRLKTYAKVSRNAKPIVPHVTGD